MFPKNATNLHIELTDRCQASCPMCARNVNGGKARPFVGMHDITLDQFKQWFDIDFLSSLNNFYACGNYGDPIIAQDCLEIFEYVRKINPYCRLGIHTNGSARNIEWWKDLAEVLGKNHAVVFGIDGFEQSHNLYRRGTSWNKIIENAKSFIDNGGNAEIDCLIFRHNEHELDSFKNQMIEIGFSKVNLKYTRRFYDMVRYPVENEKGDVEYYLEPTGKESPIHFLPLKKISDDISIWQNKVKESEIKPQCLEKNEIYVDARGNVFPCCWIGSDWIEAPIPEFMPIQKLRNLVVENSKLNFKKIGIFNLNTDKLKNMSWNNIDDFFQTNKPWTCVKNCNGRI